MLQACRNEAVAGVVRLPISVDRGCDFNLAIQVQRQMLPRDTKQLRTVRCAGISVAAQGIGGDYYDFLDLGPGKLGFVLADVSGKGIAAALLVANLQASIRSECAHGSGDLCGMLQRVNEFFVLSTLPEQYATLFFGEYDETTGRLNFVNCGQQPAILQRRGGSVERLESTALPLGLVPDWGGEMETVQLQSGDLLCVCSDGVTEAGLESGCEFGEDGLISVLETSPVQDVERVVARIAQAMCTFAPGGPTDDATIVGLRVV